MKKIYIVIAIVVVFGIGILAFIFGGDAQEKNEKKVEETFGAQMTAITGDDSKLKEAKIDTDYVKKTDKVLEDLGISANEWQNEVAHKALEKSIYSIDEIKVSEDNESEYTVFYVVTTYPVIDSIAEYFSNPNEYLSEEEYNNFINASADNTMYEKAVTGLFEAYVEGFDDIEHVDEQHAVTYIINEDGEVEFKDSNAFSNMVKAILGMNSSSALNNIQ